MNRHAGTIFIAALLTACSAKANGGAVASTDGGAGGDAGVGTGGGGGGLPCAVEPNADGKCPTARPTEIHGSALDDKRRCRLTSGEMLGCARAVGGLHSCHVEEATGKMYDVNVYTCMPNAWRDCTDAEQQVWQESVTKFCP